MDNNLAGFLSAFWTIFSFSFLVALTGAMAPGPLLTYTIIKSVNSRHRGYLMGVWIITGHAVLEMAIIVFLLFGFSFVLRNIIVVRSIGIAGGLILVYFGASILRNVRAGKIPVDFLSPADGQRHESSALEGKGIGNPFIGGILVSMSNPYWWLWWATFGFAFMIQFGVSFGQWQKLAAFFLGHEAGDLAWYLLVSLLAFFGRRHLNKKAYYGVLAVCGVLMILFGVFMGVSPFFKRSI